jgi:hypothetical protein
MSSAWRPAICFPEEGQGQANLLERDEIPYHMVGTHRRIYVRDLLAYKAKRGSKRRQVLDELTRAEAEDDIYDLEPSDDRAE